MSDALLYVFCPPLPPPLLASLLCRGRLPLTRRCGSAWIAAMPFPRLGGRGIVSTDACPGLLAGSTRLLPEACSTAVRIALLCRHPNVPVPPVELAHECHSLGSCLLTMRLIMCQGVGGRSCQKNSISSRLNSQLDYLDSWLCLQASTLFQQLETLRVHRCHDHHRPGSGLRPGRRVSLCRRLLIPAELLRLARRLCGAYWLRFRSICGCSAVLVRALLHSGRRCHAALLATR